MEEIKIQPEASQHGFEDFEKENHYTDPSNGQRFANFVIDMIIVNIISVPIGIIYGIILATNGHDASAFFDDTSGRLISKLLGVISLVLYYSIAEGFTGKTIGKLITKTKVIDIETGEKPSFGTILLRSLCRIIPFEPFSFFGSEPGGWHDRLSKTRVVNIED